jgi:hypothetical protein
MRKKSLSPWFEVDTNPTLVQRILPQNKLERFEGIDLSPSGDVLAIATSETNAVLLFRRRADGRFEDGPYQTIDGSEYPHDVSFSNWKNGELLAVAQRAGAIAIYCRVGEDVATLTPRRPGCADFPLPVLHGRASLAAVPMDDPGCWQWVTREEIIQSIPV